MENIYTILENFNRVEEAEKLSEMMGNYTIMKDGKVVARGVRATSEQDAIKQAYMKMGSASKYTGAGMDSFKAVREEQEVSEDDIDENAFNQAAAAAARAGKKEFEFGGKTHPVKMDKSTAHKLDDDVNEESKPDYIDIDKDGDKEESMKKAAKDAEKMKEDYDKDEYDEEGEMADNQLDVVHNAAKELQDIIDTDDNLPEWVQKKITLAMDYLDTARDYMSSVDDEMNESPQELEEKAVSRDQQEAAGAALSAKRGDTPASKLVGASKEMYNSMTEKELEDFAGTKHKGLPEKKKKKTQETTVAGAVATATDATGSSVYGNPSVYENEFKKKFDALTESMNVSVNASNDGNQSMSVSADGEDAVKLGHLLKMAGLFQSSGYKEPCPSCGEMHEGECTMEEYANEPNEQTQDTDFMTRTISGGLNRPKNQVNPNNPGDNPLAMKNLGKTAINLEDSIKEGLNNLYKQYKGE